MNNYFHDLASPRINAMDRPDQNYIFIISSMRSGSTLLKALLATREEVSDLPEVSFPKYKEIVSDKKLIVLKKPGWYNDRQYPPQVPAESKKIILIRHPYDTICSLNRMNIATIGEPIDSDKLLAYWVMIYKNIIERGLPSLPNTIIVKYEDIIENPYEASSRMFKFIGAHDQQGTDRYGMPEHHRWKWGKDDGGEIIRSLRVNTIAKERDDEFIFEAIHSSSEANFVLSFFGY